MPLNLGRVVDGSHAARRCWCAVIVTPPPTVPQMARSTIYTDRWRDAVRPGVIASASALVPHLMEWFHPYSVIDVGCGEGWFCAAWIDAGAERVDGMDGTYTKPLALDQPMRPRGSWSYLVRDLTEPMHDGPIEGDRPYDLAMSLEVAEHLPAGRAASFVHDLCAMAPLVVFSAAVPGQGGEGHVNEQWPDYWSDLFAAEGYLGSGALRWEVWDDDVIGAWYRQNLLVFGTVDALVEHSIRPDPCHAVIHPAMWSWKGHG